MMSSRKYKGVTTMMSSRWLLKTLLQDLFSRHSLGSITRIGGGIRSLSVFWLWLPLSSSFYHITLSSIFRIKWAFDKITMSEYWERWDVFYKINIRLFFISRSFEWSMLRIALNSISGNLQCLIVSCKRSLCLGNL